MNLTARRIRVIAGVAAAVLAACGGTDEIVPPVIDAPPPPIDAPLVDGAAVDALVEDADVEIDAPMAIACLTSAAALTVDEGAMGMFTVTLSAAPAAAVTVNVMSGDPTAALATPASLTFMPGDFDTPQEVTVTGVEDANMQDEDVTVMCTGTGIDPASVAVTVTDND